MADILLGNTGRNRELLSEWLDSSTRHRVVDTGDLETTEFDLCILDEWTLGGKATALARRKDEAAPVFLPYLLLVSERESARYEDVSVAGVDSGDEPLSLVDAIVTVPISKVALAHRIETMLRIRTQSLTLAESERKFRALVEQGLTGVFLVSDGVLTYTNDYFAAVFGYEPEALQGTEIAVLAAEIGNEALIAALETFESAERNRLAGTFEGTDEDGRRLHFMVDAHRIDPHGDGEAILGNIVDITPQVAAERKAEKRAEELALLNRIVRHDIRNDLSVVLGWGEMLEGELEGDQAASLQKILRTARHTTEITEVVRDLATLVDEGGSFDLEPIDAASMLRTEIEMTRVQFDELEVRGVADLPETAMVRSNEMLSSVFMNLLHNAVQHHDRETVVVSVSMTVDEETVAITIADDGPGIPDERKAVVFGSGEKGLDSAGTGLGLYLVDRIVRNSGGSVSLADNEPRGTVFHVTLPRAR